MGKAACGLQEDEGWQKQAPTTAGAWVASTLPPDQVSTQERTEAQEGLDSSPLSLPSLEEALQPWKVLTLCVTHTVTQS